MSLVPDVQLPPEQRGEPIHLTGDLYFQNQAATYAWYIGVGLLIVPPAGAFVLAMLISMSITTDPTEPEDGGEPDGEQS
jgi:hypothetical protein